MNEAICPCGSDRVYDNCCKPYLTRERFPTTPESLMRSRYTAYTLLNVDYIIDTMKGKALKGADREATKRWAENSEWLKLEILDAPQVSAEDSEGFVEFIAHFKENGIEQKLHERSRFLREGNRWYYIDGKYPNNNTIRNPVKMGRNELCICGSGKKFKKCCASLQTPTI